MKDIKCKCAHLKSEHHKVLWSRIYCERCPCNNYLRHDSPTLTDKLGMVFGAGIIFVFSMMVGSLWFIVGTIPEENLNDPMPDYTIRDFVNYDIVVFSSVSVIIMALVFLPVIIDYFKFKKRRDFNI